MFLRFCLSTWPLRATYTSTAVALLTCCSVFGASKSACFADIPVYDAFGNKLPFVIASVFKAGEQQLGDLLQLQNQRYGLKAVGPRLYYPEPAIGTLLEVKLEGPNRVTTKTQVAIHACHQRSSVQFGRLDTGADVRTSTLNGHISGCNLVGDWWIKATPMFGEYAEAGAYEGLIGSDGAFDITASMRGGRYIVVVGKGREPVKAFSAEVSIGGKNDAGIIDLRGFCPK